MLNRLNQYKKRLKLVVFVLLIAGCKEKFESPAPEVLSGYLVMEGVVNNDGDETNIHLSRTTSLSNTGNIPENGAMVKIISDNNAEIPLPDNGGGNYTAGSLHLDTSQKYQLYVKTSNNEEYHSDFVSVIKNPPIDSINWERGTDGVKIFINTHNPSNNTRYYQWVYDETWEFHSTFYATLKYFKINGLDAGVIDRNSGDPKIYTCWQFNSSTSLLLGSTAKLSSDIVHLPLTTIEPASWKLSVLYSINVKQYAWSKEGYDFLERMKKNTESVGSVFDAQPSELNSNIHCTSNPRLPAIGFFNISTIEEKRVFIPNTDLPGWNYKQNCPQVTIENNPDSIQKKANGLLPVAPVKTAPVNRIETFAASDATCVDCTLKGTNIKPTYWP